MAIAWGVVVDELRNDPELRCRLLVAASESSLDDAGWVQVAAQLLEAMRRAAEGHRSSAGRCALCGQPVRWVATVAGKRMPVDPLPHPMGNVELRPLGSQVAAFVHGLPELPLGREAFRTHMATCPRRTLSVHQGGRRPGPTCTVCRQPLDRVIFEAGERTHPCCSEVCSG